MKILAAEVIVCSPGRNFVTLKIECEGGIVGWGDATLNGRELSVASYLRDHVIPLLIGRDARKIEDTWQLLYRGVYWRRGPVTMAAIGAVDIALWDLKAKSLGVPLYQLFGGASRDGVLVYTHATSTSVQGVVKVARDLMAKGFRAVRIQTAVPGLSKTYGVASSNASYEPASRGTTLVEETWDSRPYLNWAPKLFEGVRAELGPDPILLHDGHHRLTPIEAGRLGKSLEPYDLFWLEDAVTGELQSGFDVVRQHTTTPLALGEVFNTIWDCQHLVTRQCIDYLRMTPSHSGGLTPLRKIAAFCEPYHVKMAPHGPSDISPIALAAALHFDLAIHNLGIQEWMGHPDEAMKVFRTNYRFADGMLHPSDEPGLGVTFDEVEAAKYPYQPAYLPIARKRDGTLTDW